MLDLLFQLGTITQRNIITLIHMVRTTGAAAKCLVRDDILDSVKRSLSMCQ